MADERTPVDDAVERYLRALVGEAQKVLGEQLVGAYVTGSIALGAYQPGRSDVDVALVTEGALPDAAKRELVQRLRHETLPCPARGLELVVYRREVASSGSVDPGFELELNTGAAMPFRESLRPEDRPDEDGHFWYALDRSILHQHGRRLVGPAAAEVFAEPGRDEVRRLLVTALLWWSRHPALTEDGPAPGAEEAVLGACRALVRHRTGRWTAKLEAGRWLLATDPVDAPLVERAITARSGGPPVSGLRAAAFLQRALEEIASG